jgi:hypothetical protein
MTDKELVFDSIFKMVRATSDLRLHSLLPEYKIACVTENFPRLMPGESLALVLISTQQLQIFFKVFFDLETFDKSTTDEANESKLIFTKDFMKEYCSLVGLHINNIFINLKIQTSMSLPLVLKGFDDFFFPYPDNINSSEQNWVLNCLGRKLYCSCFVEATVHDLMIPSTI